MVFPPGGGVATRAREGGCSTSPPTQAGQDTALAPGGVVWAEVAGGAVPAAALLEETGTDSGRRLEWSGKHEKTARVYLRSHTQKRPKHAMCVTTRLNKARLPRWYLSL